MTNIYPRVLSDLKKDQEAVVEGFIHPENSLRLIEMGIFPGMKISILFYSFFGDPIYVSYDQGKSSIILSKRQASEILIKSLPKNEIW